MGGSKSGWKTTNVELFLIKKWPLGVNFFTTWPTRWHSPQTPTAPQRTRGKTCCFVTHVPNRNFDLSSTSSWAKGPKNLIRPYLRWLKTQWKNEGALNLTVPLLRSTFLKQNVSNNTMFGRFTRWFIWFFECSHFDVFWPQKRGLKPRKGIEIKVPRRSFRPKRVPKGAEFWETKRAQGQPATLYCWGGWGRMLKMNLRFFAFAVLAGFCEEYSLGHFQEGSRCFRHLSVSSQSTCRVFQEAQHALVLDEGTRDGLEHAGTTNTWMSLRRLPVNACKEVVRIEISTQTCLDNLENLENFKNLDNLRNLEIHENLENLPNQENKITNVKTSENRKMRNFEQDKNLENCKKYKNTHNCWTS